MIDLTLFKQKMAGRPLAIAGLGKSGLPVFDACRAIGIETVLWDDDAASRAAAEQRGAVIRDLSITDLSSFGALCLAPGIPLTHPLVRAAQAAHLPIIGDIEIFHLARPDTRTIGITGTNGKSTTTALIGHLFKEAGVASAVGGNIGEAVLTLPNLAPSSIYILELSSFQLDLCDTFSPTISILTNISPDHLDRHGDMAGYMAAKERIFRSSGHAIIGVDDEWSQGIFERVKKAGQRKMIPLSCTRVLSDGLSVSEKGILIDRGQEIFDLNNCPQLKGAHNWQNAAVAYAAARACDIPLKTILDGLVSFPGLAHRQKTVGRLNGITYINDSKATNDQAAAMALRTFKPIYWIAGGKSKDGGYDNCEKYFENIQHAFLIGQAAHEIAAALHKKSIPLTQCGTLENAVTAAHAMAQKEQKSGAVVLLSPACASFDQFRSFEHRGDAFTALVEKIIGQEGA